jgi:hypothetical protein
MNQKQTSIIKRIGLVFLCIGICAVMAPVSVTFFIEDGTEIDSDGLAELIAETPRST